MSTGKGMSLRRAIASMAAPANHCPRCGLPRDLRTNAAVLHEGRRWHKRCLEAARKALEEEGFAWCRAEVCHGVVTFRFRAWGAGVESSRSHDGDVSRLSDGEIQLLGCELLGIERRYAGEVEVVHT